MAMNHLTCPVWVVEMGSLQTAAILVGGKSLRMGRDKADLVWSGLKLVEHVYDRVSPLVDEVLLVVRPERKDWAENLAPEGARVVCDRAGAEGPLAGIAAALAEATHQRVLAVACDMPNLQPDLLKAMLDDRSAQVIVPQTGHGFEPLLAVYEKSCLPIIEDILARGPSRIPAFFPEVTVSRWNEDQLRKYDPQLLSLMNLNRPEDLKKMKP